MRNKKEVINFILIISLTKDTLIIRQFVMVTVVVQPFGKTMIWEIQANLDLVILIIIFIQGVLVTFQQPKSQFEENVDQKLKFLSNFEILTR